MTSNHKTTTMTISMPEPEFELIREGDIWIAVHVQSNIASRGETPTEAVDMADEAAELHREDHDPGDSEYQRAMLDRFDIDIDLSDG